MAALKFRRATCASISRPSPGRLVLLAAVSLAVSCALLFGLLPDSKKWEYAPAGLLDDIWPGAANGRMPITTAGPMPMLKRADCVGPRGRKLRDSPDDGVRGVRLDGISYPTPFVGSYAELGIQQTWMSASGRYGAYGYGETGNASIYNRSVVNWDEIDWAALQNDCLALNRHRFPPAAGPIPVAEGQGEVRFRLRNESLVPEVRRWHEFNATRRTAVVVRAYDGYRYTPEDMYNVRSLVVEAGLRTGGEYAVVLLVNIRREGSNIFGSPEAYKDAFERAGIPPEFRSIAVLWDEALLRSWYPEIGEYRTEFQVFQPMQLFALHYPEYDHFWQLELDNRFLGDAGAYLDALSSFARSEPRKQALERSTFQYFPSRYPSYESFLSSVSSSTPGGGSHVWGPLRIHDISPIGPVPPRGGAKADDYSWGVGEDADVITTSFCTDVRAETTAWVYKGWIYGFAAAQSTPRFFCPPAIMRASRALLLAIHDAQLTKALRIPSEATLPSFALWHGLKMSAPPHPVFMREQGTEAGREKEEAWWRGGTGNASSDGLGPKDKRHPPGDGLTWWWESRWPRRVMDVWFGDEGEGEEEWPWLLVRGKDGEVYAPNVAMHPVKTQR